MRILHGIPASPGIGINDAFVLDNQELRIPQRSIVAPEVPSEIARFRQALAASTEEIHALAEQTATLDGDISKIFETHVSILHDPKIKGEVEGLIEGELCTAEYATSRVLRHWIAVFRNIKDDYFAQRGDDIRDLERRLLRHLIGDRQERLTTLTQDVVIVAHDMTPSQTAQLDRRRVGGFATEAGGSTGHTGIVARTLGIPAVVGVEGICGNVSGGDLVIIDGFRGQVVVDPDAATLSEYRRREASHRERKRALAELRMLPTETMDGYQVRLLANIELASEVPLALDAGAEGIGLYRTEFIYAEYEAPTEEDHLREYQRAIRVLDGRPLVIRTLDFGADKVFGNVELASEPNPFLGCRSIRLCFERPELFRPQLRAVLRAAVEGEVRLLFPMICGADELQRARALLEEARAELVAEGLPCVESLPLGVMIEIPSAALIADLLAPQIDFFSIGTNDLIQYTLAVDRNNEQVANLFQPAHPAILRTLRDMLEIGRRYNVGVSICGEMSGDPMFTLLLLGMGLREFSCSPGAIPEIKRLVRLTSIAQARDVAREALAFETSADVGRYLAARTRDLLPDVGLTESVGA